MISNRFNHSSFPQMTNGMNGKEENGLSGRKSFKGRIRTNKFGRKPFRISKDRKYVSSSDGSGDDNNMGGDNGLPDGNSFGSKIPLEGIELLLNRDKVPNDLGKKMDKEEYKNMENQNGDSVPNRSSPSASRFLRPDTRDRVSRKNNDSVSDISEESDSPKHEKRNRPKLLRNRDIGMPPKSFFKHHTEKKSSPPASDTESVGSDISISSGEVREASGSEADTASEVSGSGSDVGSIYGSDSGSASGSGEEGDGSDDSDGGNIGDRERRWRPASQMSREEILAEKEQLLYDYGRLADNGYRTGIKLTMKTPLETLRSEVFRLNKLRSVQRSIRFQRKILMTVTSSTEYLNKKFNPYKLALDGWSGEVLDNIGDYDEVFEELYEKYSDSVQMAPELKLLMMVGGSGLMYHLSNSLFKSSTPQMNDILSSNPNIMAQVQSAALNQMASQHSGNPLFNMMMGGVNMRNEQKEQGSTSYSQNNREPAPRTSFNRDPAPSNASSSIGASVSNVPSGQGIMRGPEGVDDILAQLNGMGVEDALVSDIEEEDVKEVSTKGRKGRVQKGRKKEDVIDLDM